MPELPPFLQRAVQGTRHALPRGSREVPPSLEELYVEWAQNSGDLSWVESPRGRWVDYQLEWAETNRSGW